MTTTIILIVGGVCLALAAHLVIAHRIKLRRKRIADDEREWDLWRRALTLNRYVTPATAARMARVSASTVNNWMNRRNADGTTRLPSYPDPRNPRRRLVRELDVLRAEHTARTSGRGRPRTGKPTTT